MHYRQARGSTSMDCFSLTRILKQSDLSPRYAVMLNAWRESFPIHNDSI